MKFCVLWIAAIASAGSSQTQPNGASLQAEAAAQAVPVTSSVSAVEPAPSAPVIAIPALTPVVLDIQADISSKTAKIGEMFPIRLAEPIIIAGKTIVPAGVTGQGEIIHAAKARAAGKAGELILAARYLDWNGTRIPLRTFRYGPEAGQSRVTEAVAVGTIVVAPLILVIAGGEKTVTTNTRATAKVAQDVPQVATR